MRGKHNNEWWILEKQSVSRFVPHVHGCQRPPVCLSVRLSHLSLRTCTLCNVIHDAKLHGWHFLHYGTKKGNMYVILSKTLHFVGRCQKYWYSMTVWLSKTLPSSILEKKKTINLKWHTKNATIWKKITVKKLWMLKFTKYMHREVWLLKTLPSSILEKKKYHRILNDMLTMALKNATIWKKIYGCKNSQKNICIVMKTGNNVEK